MALLWQMSLMSNFCHAPRDEGIQIARLRGSGTLMVEERLRESCCVKLKVEDRRRVIGIILCDSASMRSCVSGVGTGSSVCSNGQTLMSRSICMELVLRCGFTHNFNEYSTLAALMTFQVGGTGCKSATKGTLILSGNSNSKGHS